MQIREPAEDTIRREDDIKLAVEGVGQIVEVGLDERGGNAHLTRELTRIGDGLLREVDAGDRRAESRPAQGILAEVALEVKQ